MLVQDTPIHRASEAIAPGLWAKHDPFLLMMEDRFEVGAFGWHPHRGIETITYVIDGNLEHHDNRGGGGVLGARDIQLMTAGRGIIHVEQPPESQSVHLLQLWLNMPAAEKMSEPRYQDLRAVEMPRRVEPGAQITVYSGVSGSQSAHTLNHVPFTLVEVDLTAGSSVVQSLPGSYNGFVHVIHGEGHFGADATAGTTGQTLWLDRPEGASDTTVTISAVSDLRVLIAAGEPLGEPVAAAGPFVMNTQEQLRQAFADYQAGRFDPQ
jgi:redox-sensitive bicupin YhaK (pirin superfamily)